MRKLTRSRVTLVLVTAFAFLLSSTAGANPRKKKTITQADLDRLEQKLEAQQKQIDKLIKLQQQYLAALSAIFEGTASSSGHSPAPAATPPPASDKPADAKPATPPTKPVADMKSIDAKPAVAVQPRSGAEPIKPKKAEGLGTVVGKVAGAGDAIVYVEDIVAPVKGSATMKQEGKEFVPNVLVVTKGTTVEFPNRDAIFHNVFSVTPDHSFDLGSYRQGQSKSVTLSKSGVVTVYCNMHPQMVGHILVVPSAHYVRAGKDGFFRLTNVPAGNRRIVAWAPNAKPTVVEANVTDGEVATVELSVKKGRAALHTKKDGMPYGSYEK